jgi:hypothetical protein
MVDMIFLSRWLGTSFLRTICRSFLKSIPESLNLRATDALSKILERLLLHRLKSHVAVHRICLDEQVRFPEKHSTSHQILRVTKHLRLWTGGQTFDWNAVVGHSIMCGMMCCFINFCNTVFLWSIYIYKAHYLVLLNWPKILCYCWG